ncbi:MAG: CRISPR-associated endonuclease Cas1 [Thaumarchaeota archaeon 13_1_40CM_2_39_4]|nr:MAG: CRISPR-associated endonuclease Cas1 [Thaumarchaeota archaeon 13_1_40CM_2_39_4]
MNPLLVSGFGISIHVDRRKLVVHDRLKDEKIAFYPHQIDFDSIIIDGHTGNITFEAIRWLMKHDINVTLLTWNGNLLGSVLQKEPKSGKLRVKQYSKYLDGKSRFAIASGLVGQKIEHTFSLLTELSRYYPEIDLAKVERVFEIEKSNYSIGQKSVNHLINYEGRIATFYWDCLVKAFNRLYPNFHFQSRKNKSYSWNMNASDEVNALFNYGYAVLESEVRKAINAVGLDPTVGFLHELAESKEPLVYDIQELFRWLIDLSVIQLLEERKLKKSDFIVTENYHIRLKQSAAKALIEKISINFNKKVMYKRNKRYSYQSILLDNVQQLANLISDKCKGDSSIFTIPKIVIERNDSLNMRERILNMSPAERKYLGINKSTLWYMKRNVAAGKKIKVYDKVLNRLCVTPALERGASD